MKRILLSILVILMIIIIIAGYKSKDFSPKVEQIKEDITEKINKNE